MSYLYWTSTAARRTDAEKCISQIGAANITTAELKLVWNQTYSAGWRRRARRGTASPAAPTAGEHDPIYAYWAQNGSGTQSTWATATGAASRASANWPSKQIIFENETSSILGNDSMHRR